VRISEPRFMRAWPRGLRPARIRAGAGACLLYVHPEAGWVEVWLDRAAGGVRTREGDGEGFDEGAVRRLRAAIAHRLSLDAPAAERWVEDVDAHAAEVHERASAIHAPMNDALRVLRARDDLVDALEGFDPDAPAPEDPAALACRAFLTAMAGLPVLAKAQLERAASLACGAAERAPIGRLLLSLGHAKEAAACLEAGLEQGRVSPSVIAHAAADARHPELAARAVRRLLRTDASADELDRALELLVQAGAYDEAMQLLSELRSPSALALTLLAELHLWKRDTERALALAVKAVDARGGERAALAVGAALSQRGEHEGALALLATIPPGPSHATATLWRVRSLLALGRAGEAAIAVNPAAFADRIPWKLWRAEAESRASGAKMLRAPQAFQVQIILEHMFGAEETERAFEADDTATALLARAIDRLGGNYTERPTFLEDGRLVTVPFVSPRNMAIAAQAALTTTSLEEVVRELDSQGARMPRSPFPRTYRAELFLWTGEYERARESFERIWTETKTRWGYVGLGAALGLLGRYDEALAAWEAGLEHYAYLKQEGTFAYRGEVLMHMGRHDEALSELEHATSATESRTGAWVALAVARARAGDASGARQALDRVAAYAPGLSCFAAKSAGLSPREVELPGVLALSERMLHALRGNRASKVFTFVDDAGRLRALLAAPERHWRTAAERVAPLALDLLALDAERPA
jgi:tetratricopeptide (TPR) repeat protein